MLRSDFLDARALSSFRSILGHVAGNYSAAAGSSWTGLPVVAGHPGRRNSIRRHRGAAKPARLPATAGSDRARYVLAIAALAATLAGLALKTALSDFGRVRARQQSHGLAHSAGRAGRHRGARRGRMAT